MFYFRKSGFSSRFISFDTFSSPYFALARQLWTLPREVSRELHWKRKERKKHQQRFISLTGVLKVSTISSAFCTFVIATGFNLLRWYDTAMWSWRGGGGMFAITQTRLLSTCPPFLSVLYSNTNSYSVPSSALWTLTVTRASSSFSSSLWWPTLTLWRHWHGPADSSFLLPYAGMVTNFNSLKTHIVCMLDSSSSV